MNTLFILRPNIVSITVLLLFLQDIHALTRYNVSYGPNQEQILDLYNPEGSGPASPKVIVLIHGGAWAGGDKKEMDEFLPFLQTGFPNYSIANINYRLGNSSSPGFPKQLEDINLALTFIQSELNLQSAQFALFGGSAGAHLSLLYAYGFDKNSTVKVVVDLVGPVDFTDLIYAVLPMYNGLFFPFIGPYLFIQNVGIYKQASPVTYITKNSPPTISFYGLLDLLVPVSQGPNLKQKLDRAGVKNEMNLYLGGHYFDWSANDKQNMRTKIVNFLNLHF